MKLSVSTLFKITYLVVRDMGMSFWLGITAIALAIDYKEGTVRWGHVKVTVSLCHSWAPSCRTLLIYTSDSSIQLVFYCSLTTDQAKFPKET